MTMRWWYGYEEADEGEWVYEEYANDENYYENHDASDESWQEVDLEAGMTSGSASDSNVSGEYNEAYYRTVSYTHLTLPTKLEV